MVELNEYRIIEAIENLGEKIESRFGDEWLSTNDVVKYANVSKRTIGEHIRRGTLKVSQATGKNLFKKVWIDSWLENKR